MLVIRCSFRFRHVAMCRPFASYQRFVPPAAPPGSPEFHLQRKKKKYVELIKSLTRPHPEYFIADGVRYELPWTPDSTPLIETEEGIPKDQLEFFAVWLGSSSSISIHPSSTKCLRCRIASDRAYDSAEILVALARAFGGRIRASGPVAGLRKPTVQWNVGAEHARRVAAVLAQFPSINQDRFEIVSRWSNDQENRRALHKEIMANKTNRKPDPEFRYLECIDSVYQFAAMFDSHATLTSANCRYVSIRFTHYHREALEKIQEYLASQGLPTGGISSNRQYSNQRYLTRHQWRLTRHSDIIQVLEFVRPYLMCKRRIVDFVLKTATPFSHEQIQEFSSYNGRQGKSQARDEKGRELSIQLQKHQCELSRRKKSKTPSEAIQHIVNNIRMDKYQHRLATETQRYRNSLRELLAVGAKVL